jgi:hypothetical protein
MKHAVWAMLASAIVAPYSFAQMTEGQQWTPSKLMMIDLVKGGYRVVAYQDNTTPASDITTTTYLLQKDSSLFRCDERLMSYNSKTNKNKSVFICWELVKPFE